MRNGRFELLIPDELMARVDEWRQQQTVPPTRAAAIRHLIESGLGDDAAREACAEAYQVIGSLAYQAGVFDHDDVIEALDNTLAAADGRKRPHDLLPWPKRQMNIAVNSR